MNYVLFLWGKSRNNSRGVNCGQYFFRRMQSTISDNQVEDSKLTWMMSLTPEEYDWPKNMESKATSPAIS